MHHHNCHGKNKQNVTISEKNGPMALFVEVKGESAFTACGAVEPTEMENSNRLCRQSMQAWTCRTPWLQLQSFKTPTSNRHTVLGSQECHRYGWKTQPRTPKGSGIQSSQWTKTWLSIHDPAGQQQQATGSTCLALFNLSKPGCNHNINKQHKLGKNKTNRFFYFLFFVNMDLLACLLKVVCACWNTHCPLVLLLFFS